MSIDIDAQVSTLQTLANVMKSRRIMSDRQLNPAWTAHQESFPEYAGPDVEDGRRIAGRCGIAMTSAKSGIFLTD
ncbi:hypothetical protein [Agrobacterium pusense]|uniref:hypothetical protein n=1 Tax=Agrobacterium pusense TaxID=648995 RepID=UPI000A49AB8C|nr:hypothetical protein [Agrobacterium pusense]QWW74282.1 hypothetical protein KP800_01890 [Agrobacterium pusense]